MSEEPHVVAANLGSAAAAGSKTPPAVQIDPAKLAKKMAELRSKQNLLMGTLAGLGAAIVGAIVWAAVTMATNFQLGLMAIVVGAVVGIAMRKFGGGVDKQFRIVAAGEALLGCALGNLLIVCCAIAKTQGISVFEVLPRLTPDIAVDLLGKSFDTMDLLFYGIATYEGYKFALRRLTPEELQEVSRG